MIDKMLVAATMKAFEQLFDDNGIPYTVRDDAETEIYRNLWNESGDKALHLRKAVPAVRRIAAKEPYIFKKDGDPIEIRLNYLDRELSDSFGDIMIERKDLDWRFAISVKSDAKIIAELPVADREVDQPGGEFNEIDDFGDRIFGIPCSNDYFNDMNEILLKIKPHDDENWAELIKDETFIYDSIITPMISAISRELPRICKGHPEAPQKFIDYFYRKLDYYFIFPVNEVQVTRIGAINAHGGLGRMPGNPNLTIPRVDPPAKLLDVRFGRGPHGELSKDTLQVSFDGGWSVCILISAEYDKFGELGFNLKVYLPATPFGSYRDQVAWDPEV